MNILYVNLSRAKEKLRRVDLENYRLRERLSQYEPIDLFFGA